MYSKEDRIIGYIAGSIILLFVSYFLFGFLERNRYFENTEAEKKIKIAVVTDVLVGGKVGPRFEYEFIVNEVKYVSSYSLEADLSVKPRSELMEYVGNRYYVKYSVEKPKYNELLLNHRRIKNDSLEAPTGGWAVDGYWH